MKRTGVDHAGDIQLEEITMSARKSFVAPCVLAIIAAFANPSLGDELSVNGVTLDYEESGSGPTVVFVHGAISDKRVWEPYRDTISEKWHFVSFDQRYFGTRDWPDDGQNLSADTHAADLIALVETLDTAPVGLVAWSYGGDVAARAAIARPDLFYAIVLYEPYVPGIIDGLPGASAAAKQLFAGFGPAFTAIEAGRLEEAALRFIEAVFDLPEGGAETEPEYWRKVWQQNGRTIPPYLQGLGGEIATCEDLAAIHVPMLVVQGGASTVYDAMMAEKMAACEANAVVVTLQGANHDGPYRHPDQFLTMIDGFLDLATAGR